MGGRRFAVTVAYQATAAGLRQASIRARADTGEGALLVAVLPPPGVR